MTRKMVSLALLSMIIATLSDVVFARLYIQSPKRLADKFTGPNGKKGVIQASYANFGFIPYGHSIVSL